jgi:hypothetical protein
VVEVCSGDLISPALRVSTMQRGRERNKKRRRKRSTKIWYKIHKNVFQIVYSSYSVKIK